MRELGFLVADKNIEACVHGLLGRDKWHLAMDCAALDATTGDWP